jgi:arylsulfatase
MQAAPREEPVKAWDALTPGERDREDLRMATYAAMVERMDAGVGRVLDAIERLGATQDTLVMFASDNGADGKDQKTTGPEPGPAGSWWYAGPGWAWASNTPFRKFKTWNHEGGISDPLIVSWPARIKPGWDRQVAHVTDITATCLAAAGRSNGRILGQSLLPGAERRIHQELCWAVLRAKAIRSGDLKAVTRADGPWELYDLAKDRTELHDLAQERPEVLAGMTARWQEWSKQVEIIGGRP